MLRLFPPKPRQNPLSDTSRFRFDGQNWISRKYGRDVIAKAKPAVLSKMVRVQDEMGKPLTLTSGHRGPVKIDGKTYDHNRIAGGAPRSTHVPGLALDVSSRNLSPDEAAKFVRSASGEGFRSIQQYPGGNFHVDIGNPRQWTNARDPQVAAAIRDHYAGRIAQAPQQQPVRTVAMADPGPRIAPQAETPAPQSVTAMPDIPGQAPSQEVLGPSQESAPAKPFLGMDKDKRRKLAEALMLAGSAYTAPQQMPVQDSFVVQAAPMAPLNPTPQNMDPQMLAMIRALTA